MRSPGRVFWPLASVLLLADCSTKRAIEADSIVGVPTTVIDGFLRFTLKYNQGASFSTYLGPYQRWLLIALAIAMLVVLVRSYRHIAQFGRMAMVGSALVAGGAAGNLLDRLRSARGVVDFIDVGVGASRFYLFNVADAGISVGAVLIAYAIWQRDRAMTGRAHA
jgi:signal peptidase II